MTDIVELAKACRRGSYDLAVLETSKKNEALNNIAKVLQEHKDEIFSANKLDVQQACDNKLNQALVDRLTLNDSRFTEMVEGVKKVALLDDPTDRLYDGRTLENGLTLYKRAVPFGVVGVIYEARPNVTVDIAALCLKSGNACFLRGGKEAINTNRVLHKLICSALKNLDLDEHMVTFLDDTSREYVAKMLALNEYIDVLIPRGGEALQRMCQKESSIPVIIGGFGISHIFVDESADLNRCVDIIINAKTQKPSACNSLDTLLLHEKIAQKFIELLTPKLKDKQVTVFAHGVAYDYFKDYPYLQEGKSEDLDREFLSLAMNVKVISDVYEAVEQLRLHHASHSDAILTDSVKNAKIFTHAAGSACVYVNASTRFSDGGQFGLGAEVAISTQKLHARGPMALQELTTYQYVCEGDYLTRR